MHEYTAWKVHEDRLRDLTREGDASRLAAIARAARPRRRRVAMLRRWVASTLFRGHGTPPSQPEASPAGSNLASRAG